MLKKRKYHKIPLPAVVLDGVYDPGYLGNYVKFLYRDEINSLFFIIDNTEVYDFDSDNGVWVVLTFSTAVYDAVLKQYGKKNVNVIDIPQGNEVSYYTDGTKQVGDAVLGYTMIIVNSDLITLLDTVNVRNLTRKQSKDFSDLEKRFAHKILSLGV